MLKTLKSDLGSCAMKYGYDNEQFVALHEILVSIDKSVAPVSKNTGV
jgi:hypothetical protein